jgi:hypothetical protein
MTERERELEMAIRVLLEFCDIAIEQEMGLGSIEALRFQVSKCRTQLGLAKAKLNDS